MNDLLLQHPTNLGLNLGNVSSTNKKWTERYHGITLRQLKLHTTYVNGGFTYADWTPLVALCSDENLRRREPSYPANPRAVWLLGAEENVKQYYIVELSSVVLSKFVQFPEVNSQGDIPKLRGNGGNRVDIIYHWGDRELVIGDFKRNTFRAKLWMDGRFEKKADQQRLARELRGYACEYECPQVILFDIDYVGFFQFRAERAHDLKDCDVDCWILPRVENNSQPGYPIRHAIYMFIVQGLRRVQSESWPLPRIGNHEASMRAWFSGKPLWKGSSGSLSRKHPEGYERDTDESGTMCWKYGHQWLDLADSISLWEGNQQEQEEADLYSAD